MADQKHAVHMVAASQEVVATTHAVVMENLEAVMALPIVATAMRHRGVVMTPLEAVMIHLVAAIPHMSAVAYMYLTGAVDIRVIAENLR